MCFVTAEPELRGAEESIDDVVGRAISIVHELPSTLGTHDEPRRKLALRNSRRKLDVDALAIVEGAKRPPGWLVATDGVAKQQSFQCDSLCDRSRRFGAHSL